MSAADADKRVLYTRPRDLITERVVSELPDFGGWRDGEPVRALVKGQLFDPDDERQDEFEVGDSEPGAPPIDGPLEPEPSAPAKANLDTRNDPDDDEWRCPTCGVLLPDPNHLVTGSTPSLRRKRVTQ
jgi:hypothetical protein